MPQGHNRLFVEAVLYTARVGHPWRDLPAEFGHWHSVSVRFARWETYGVGHRVAEALRGDADLEELLIDSTVVRAHPHAPISGYCEQALVSIYFM